jgi:hypothetical protein
VDAPVITTGRSCLVMPVMKHTVEEASPVREPPSLL